MCLFSLKRGAVSLARLRVNSYPVAAKNKNTPPTKTKKAPTKSQVVYEDNTTEVPSDKELQEIFNETKNITVKPVKQATPKVKKEKIKKGKGLNEILSGLAKERKAKKTK